MNISMWGWLGEDGGELSSVSSFPPVLQVDKVRSFSPSLFPSLSPHPTYTHLHIELLGRRGGGVGPRHVGICGHVAVTVGSVPLVGTGGPGQSGPEG